MWSTNNLVRAISLIAAIVSVSSAAVYHTKFTGQRSTLLTDIFEFIAVIPYDEVEGIIIEKADNDADVRATLDYLGTEDFQARIEDMSQISEFESILEYLEENNTPAHDMWNLFRMIMGLDPVRKNSKFGPLPIGPIPTGPTLEMIDEILSVIDPQEIKNVYDQKIKESEDFNNLVTAMENEKFEALVTALEDSGKFKELVLDQLIDHGFDLLEILNKAGRFFLDAIQA